MLSISNTALTFAGFPPSFGRSKFLPFPDRYSAGHIGNFGTGKIGRAGGQPSRQRATVAPFSEAEHFAAVLPPESGPG